jgi:hypothetical protein
MSAAFFSGAFTETFVVLLFWLQAVKSIAVATAK